MAMYVVHQISLACKIFLVISYLVLPGKRGQPHTSVLLLFISDSLWFASFNIMPGITNSCVNDFKISTAQNSLSCGIQGVLTIYFIHTTVLWCSLLIYKLHLLAVWRSDVIERYFSWVAAFCWMFPLVFVVPIAVKGLAQFPGVGASCLVSQANLNTYLFYPTAVYFYPALLLHVFTASKMIHVALVSSKMDGNEGGPSELSLNSRPNRVNRIPLKMLLRNQWRPALMLTLLTCCITFFWLYIFLENQREIASQQPSIILFGSAEMLVASSGIIIAMVFAAKAEFWAKWSLLLHDTRGHGAFKSWMERRRRWSSTSPIVQHQEHDSNSYQSYDAKIRSGSRGDHDDALPAAFDADVVKEHGNAQRHPHSVDGRTAGHQQARMYLPGDKLSKVEPSPSKMNIPAVPIAECLASPERAHRVVSSPSRQYEKRFILPLPVPCSPSKPKDLKISQRKLCSPQLPTLPLDSLPVPVLLAPPTCPSPPKPQAEYLSSPTHVRRPSAQGPVNQAARLHSSANSDKIMLASCRSFKSTTEKCLDKVQIESPHSQTISPMPPTIPSRNPARVQSHTMHSTVPPLYPPACGSSMLEKEVPQCE
ncbi:unnamed protein product [Mortierella alpina]